MASTQSFCAYKEEISEEAKKMKSNRRYFAMVLFN
jgi:hypothetical protein